MARRKGLGRGLDALLGGGGSEATADKAPASAADSGQRDLPIEWIRPNPYQPREHFDPEALNELTRSIRSHGMMQPVLVRPVGKNQYELVAGERRWRAAQAAGLAEVPAVVRDIPDADALALAIIENIQREDLSPLEQARGFARLISEFSMTHGQVAQMVGRSRPAVSNLLRLLDLDEDARALLEAGEIEVGHARALLGLPEGAQGEPARQVAARGLSVRQTEALVARLRDVGDAGEAPDGDGAPTEPDADDPDMRRLVHRLCELLGAEVHLRHGRRGSGRLVIRYHSLDELDGILERLDPEFHSSSEE